MTMHLFVTAIIWFGILCAGLFLAARAVGVGLFSYHKWSERKRHAS